MEKKLILASASPFRRELLERLHLPFEVKSADIDESALADETAIGLAIRLSAEKAAHIAKQYPDAVVIGADQTAVCDDYILRKPTSVEAQADMLYACRGMAIEFFTAVAINHGGAAPIQHIDYTTCVMRDLTRGQCEAYAEKEPATASAGGFKIEALGISLFSRVTSDDPTALIGLPLMWTTQTLETMGFDPLA